MKLRSSILLGLLAVALIPLAASVAVYLPSTLAALKNAATDQASIAAEANAIVIDRRMADLKVASLRLAEIASDKNLMAVLERKRFSDAAGQLAEPIDRWLDRLPEVVGLRIFDPKGSAIFRLRLGSDGEVVLDEQSTPAPASPELAANELAQDDVEIRIALVVDESDPAMLLVAAPITDGASNKLATLVLEANLSTLNGQLVDHYWIDAGGNYLHRPTNAPDLETRSAFVEFPGIADSLDEEQPFIWASQRGKVHWAPLQLDARAVARTWVGQRIDFAAADAWLEWYRLTLLPIIGAAILLAVLLSERLAGRVIRFSRHIVKGFNKLIQTGDRVSFDVRGGAELRNIAHELNGIGEHYVKNQAALKVAENKLKDRKRELERQLGDMAVEKDKTQSLLEATPEPLYGLDMEGKCTFCNDSAAAFFGLESREELVGRTIPGELLMLGGGGETREERGQRLLSRVKRGETVHDSTGTARHADGKDLPIESWWRAVNEDGQAVGVMMTVRDLTEQKQQVAALQRDKTLVQVSLDSIGEGIVTADKSGKVRYLNPAGAKMLGWSREEALGVSLDSILPSKQELRDPANDADDNEDEHDKDGEATERGYLLADLHGRHLYLEETLSPMTDGAGKKLGSVVVFRDVTGSPRLAHDDQYKSTHDVLTGLINRGEFEQRLGNAIEAARGSYCKHVLCYLDLDQFRNINDTCGEAAGDSLLRQLASLIMSKLRVRDSVARLGGDDFAILLEHCPMDQALRIASQLRQSIQEFNFEWEGLSPAFTTSIGIIPVSPEAQSAAGLLGVAEATCYQAKTVGGNRVKVFRPNDKDISKFSQGHWVTRINQALEENGFRLFYQPIVSVKGGRTSNRNQHIALLLRMVDEEGNFAAAGKFLPFAERYNMVQITDRWVVRSTFEWLATWDPETIDLTVEISLSEPTINDPEFCDYVLQLYEDTSFPAHWACLRLDANAAMAKLAGANRLIQALQPLGFEFSLDNVGMGLWSIDQLKNLQVDYFKIDGEQVKNLARSPLNQAIVKSIIEVARVLGRKTIAKSVEDDATLDILRELGVDLAQGYGIVRPRPLEFLKASRRATSAPTARPAE